MQEVTSQNQELELQNKKLRFLVKELLKRDKKIFTPPTYKNMLEAF